MNLTNKLLTSAALYFSVAAGGCSGQKEHVTAQKPQAIALEQGVEEHYIKRVIDGDTLVLDDGRHVRLLGINAPELKKKGQKHPERFAVEASDRLGHLVCGERKVKLEYDLQDKNKEDKDKFGRLCHGFHV
jgi:endonuclease YncB( thermonuclease family)